MHGEAPSSGGFPREQEVPLVTLREYRETQNQAINVQPNGHNHNQYERSIDSTDKNQNKNSPLKNNNYSSKNDNFR